MESALEYLARMGDSLAREYAPRTTLRLDPDKPCYTVALEAALRLCAEGKSPFILHYVDLVPHAESVEPLLPRRYGGEISWQAHFVACADGAVFDPVLGKPVSLEHYAREMFGRDVERYVKHSVQQTQEVLSRVVRGGDSA